MKGFQLEPCTKHKHNLHMKVLTLHGLPTLRSLGCLFRNDFNCLTLIMTCSLSMKAHAA